MLTLAGCGGSESDGTANGDTVNGDAPAENGQPQDGAASGQTLWMTILGGGSLSGLDTGSGDRVNTGLLQVAPVGTIVKHMVAAEGKVWIGLGNGKLLIVDAKTGKLAETLTFDAKDYGIEEMTVGGGNAYVAYAGPTLVRIDATTYEKQKQAPVVGRIHDCDGMLVDGGTLWVLQGNGFALIKADASTLAVRDSVRIGSHPADPTGPFKALYGHGTMVQVGGNVWIIDRSSRTLIRVEKATMKATRVADLRDTVTPNTSVRMAANADSFFVSFSDDDAAKVVRYDGATGEAGKTYEFGPGAARSLAVTGDRLFVTSDEFGRDVLQVDIQSGQTLKTFSNVGATLVAVAA
jgi:outer membrane protein assembly factor BamB